MNSKAILSLALTLTLSGINYAHADQCDVLTPPQAASATNLVDTQKVGKVLNFCQPCGDTVPKELAVTSVSTKTDPNAPFPGMDGFTLDFYISGTWVDLAYTYVKVDASTWVNLGLLANCDFFQFDPNNLNAPGKLTKVSGVSQFITEENGKYTPSTIY